VRVSQDTQHGQPNHTFALCSRALETSDAARHLSPPLFVFPERGGSAEGMERVTQTGGVSVGQQWRAAIISSHK
jgi:hypothetical protein